MENSSFILPLNAWAYLLGLQNCRSLWCFRTQQKLDTKKGLEYLLEQGLVITDGKSMLVDPYLLQVTGEMLAGRWCVHFEYDNSRLTMVAGSNGFLTIKQISVSLYRIGMYTEKHAFFEALEEEIMEEAWESIGLVLANPQEIMGESHISRERFPDVMKRLRQQEDTVSGKQSDC